MEAEAGRRGARGLPGFAVELQPPDLLAWRDGNTGVRGFTTLDSGVAGPHVAVVSLMHGNEFAGAIVLDGLLREGMRPRRGRLTLGFANLDAFARFDPLAPTASRYVDEDLNRLWDRGTLDGPRSSRELARARAMRPLLETADVLLDLHSMLWPSDPLILSGPSAKGRALGLAIGTPGLVVSDDGHRSGRRLIDHAPFTDPSSARAAVLVEAGQHWSADTVATTRGCVLALLRRTGLCGSDVADGPGGAEEAAPARCAEVTLAVTAASSGFAFVRPYRGGEVIARRGTLIARDGAAEIRTPHDDCLLVMPSLRPSRGHTAVRLACFVDGQPSGPLPAGLAFPA